MEASESKLLLIIFVAFPFLWIFAIFILSQFSGWAGLAEHYKSDRPINASKSRFRTMSLGRGTILDVNFSNVVTLEGDSEAIALSLMFPFHFYHPRLVIPLQDISAETFRYFGILKAVRFTFSKSPQTKLTALRSWANWVEQNSNGAWSIN